MASEVVIDRRFRGPPASANGGYACGLAAGAMGARVAEVNLRRPPPLERPLAVEADRDEVRILDGEVVVVDGRRLDSVELELPDPPPLDLAIEADRRYPFYDDHSFPDCFVCGPDRDPGDGLCIYPGPIEGAQVMACCWMPEAGFAEDDGVRDEIVWAALDCPSGLAAGHYATDEVTMVLARMRGQITCDLEPARPHIVIGWALEIDDRKHRAGTAIYDAAGEPRAWADALWIELREDEE